MPYLKKAADEIIVEALQLATREWILSIGARGVMSTAQQQVLSLGNWKDGHYPLLWSLGNLRESAPDEWSHFGQMLSEAPTRGQVRLWLEEDAA